MCGRLVNSKNVQLEVLGKVSAKTTINPDTTDSSNPLSTV